MTTTRRRIALGTVTTIVLGLAIACGTTGATPSTTASSPSAPGETPTSSPAPPASATPITAGTRVDLTRLPIGDGRVASTPTRGSVFACQRTFGGGGAFRDGAWIRGDGTFDLTAKIAVQGNVKFGGEFAAAVVAGARSLTGNGLPTTPAGVFPVQQSDAAYQYDRNPNTIHANTVRLSLPTQPTVAAQPSCLPMGAIGVMVDGVVLFNALDAMGRDAVAHEILDACGGHPERSGQYHHHDQSPCLDDGAGGHSPLIGYANDGFGIFGHRGEQGGVLTNADLDECHGHTHPVEWDGRTVALYHYHATHEYPYTLGCYRGTPVRTGP